jgi:hypothetical protein
MLAAVPPALADLGPKVAIRDCRRCGPVHLTARKLITPTKQLMESPSDTLKLSSVIVILAPASVKYAAPVR